jgi:hypothetical protein
MWARRLVVAREGQTVAPERLAAFSALGRMSDALLRLIEPYASWPPSRGEMPVFRAWMELGAKVWNTVVSSSGGGRASGTSLDAVLKAIEADWALLGEAEPGAVKRALAERKRRLFDHDYRTVSHVRVWEEGKLAMVEAGTMTYVK